MTNDTRKDRSHLEAALSKLAAWHDSQKKLSDDFSTHPAWDHPHPLHTVYGGAHLFKVTTIPKLRQLAQKAFDDHCPTPEKFRDAFRLQAGGENDQFRLDISHSGSVFPLAVLDRVFNRLKKKLATNAVEDYRIDFEDGLGIRTDAEEDSLAVQAAQAFIESSKAHCLPPLVGIRIKSFANPSSTLRAVRTLKTFLTAAVQADSSAFPPILIVTLPKVTNHLQVKAFVQLLRDIPNRYPLEHCKIYGEIMLESADALSGGNRTLRELVAEDHDILLGVHFGAHDYLASLNSAGVHPNLRHPFCDYARILLKTSLSHTPLAIVDGAETFLPIGRDDVVKHAWRLSFNNVWHALDHGIYQGWDLHPAQIPARFAAVFTYFLSGMPSATARLKNFVEGLTQAARVGAHFDDLATAQGLLNFFEQAMRCGAVTAEEVKELNLDFGDIKSQMRLIPRLTDVPPKTHKDLWPERD